MISNEKKINNLFSAWLLITLILVFLIVIVGGLTRLTNSGLSITEWELFEGVLPPLNEKSWNFYFDLYKEIPQYKLLNFNMNIEEFKVIFYWEYFHRLFARIIGIFFLIPLIFFYLSNFIKKEYLNICYLIFMLIVLQGIVGWYMVKSGLVNDITVSHYRLSIHLLNAFLILSIIFWLRKNFLLQKSKIFFELKKKYFPFQLLISLIFIQIILGAFVSGLDAGKIYQTWPLMGQNYFPDDLVIKKVSDMLVFDNHSLVQFYHRNLAYIIILYSIFLTIFVYKKKITTLYKPLHLFLLILSIQAALGILTLVSGLNIYLASIHQVTSLLLVISALNLYYLRVK